MNSSGRYAGERCRAFKPTWGDTWVVFVVYNTPTPYYLLDRDSSRIHQFGTDDFCTVSASCQMSSNGFGNLARSDLSRTLMKEEESCWLISKRKVLAAGWQHVKQKFIAMVSTTKNVHPLHRESSCLQFRSSPSRPFHNVALSK